MVWCVPGVQLFAPRLCDLLTLFLSREPQHRLIWRKYYLKCQLLHVIPFDIQWKRSRTHSLYNIHTSRVRPLRLLSFGMPFGGRSYDDSRTLAACPWSFLHVCTGTEFISTVLFLSRGASPCNSERLNPRNSFACCGISMQSSLWSSR